MVCAQATTARQDSREWTFTKCDFDLETGLPRTLYSKTGLKPDSWSQGYVGQEGYLFFEVLVCTYVYSASVHAIVQIPVDVQYPGALYVCADEHLRPMPLDRALDVAEIESFGCWLLSYVGFFSGTNVSWFQVDIMEIKFARFSK